MSSLKQLKSLDNKRLKSETETFTVMTIENMDKMEKDDRISFLEKQVKELTERVDKIEKQNACRDSNHKLSIYAQKTIEASTGPLKPEELQIFLTDEVLNSHSKKILPIIRKYSDNIDGVKKQILWVYDNIEIHMIHMKQQKELDDKLIKKIRKLKKSVEEEQDKENKTHLDIEIRMIHRKELEDRLIKKAKRMEKSAEEEEEEDKENKAQLPNSNNCKIQSTLKQYYDMISCKTSDGNRKESTKPKVLEVSQKGKHGMSVEQSEKGNRKRKSMISDESSTSQENNITRISSGFNKHLKLNSPENSAELSPELMSVEELDECNSQHTEQMSVESQSTIEPMSVESQSIIEPMSVESMGGSSETMSIESLEELSSLSYVMSADDTIETIKKTKSTKKLRGKVSKQAESKLGKDAADLNKNEETVPERYLRVRK